MNLFDMPEGVPSLIKIGEISSIDPAKCTARVVFDDEDSIVSFDLPVLQRNSLKNHDYAMPDVGEDAIVLFFGEGQEDGVILGSIYAGEVTPPESTENRRTVVFDDDTRVCYDRAEHKLTVTIEGTEVVFNRQDGSITVPNAVTINCTTATVNASSGITLDTPKTDVTGVLNVAGLITGKGGLAVSGGGGAAVTVTGNMKLQGQIEASSDVTAGGISLMKHKHQEQGDGAPTSPPL
ncbi:MAG: phage baseplate assembly protein V [Escherichia coli]|jgi:phage baseplate assembly protein V|nr:phage baseplate assembly protein V [Escherichia coli]DAI64514.1 MAG TPA: baseplate assembly protein [Caudoviricetes sp.]DAK00036.1 MAG TPA: baseplate assembly protein [Bacteriophage sp.]MBL0994543.1 phage baseplate assembly protein V [Escherichia coli]MBL1009842.1 phage baseplate assembly protein V [Escherichia coli]